MIRASVRFVLRWQARSPFLAPLFLSIVIVFSIGLTSLFFQGLVVWLAGQGGIDLDPFVLSLLLTFPVLIVVAPAGWTAFFLAVEAMWMAFGVYELLGARDNAIRDSIRRWARYELEETKT